MTVKTKKVTQNFVYKTRSGDSNNAPAQNWVFPVGFYSQRTGSSVPNWKRTIKAGGSATSVMSAYRSSGRSSPGNSSVFWKVPVSPSYPTGVQMEQVIGQYMLPTDIHPSSPISTVTADNQALTRFYKDLRGEKGPLQGLTFLAELREAIHMLRHPAQGLFKGLRNYTEALERKKKPRRGKRWNNRMLQDTWLEYSFGWVPLVSDCKSIAEALGHLVDDRRRSTVRGHGSQETELSAFTTLTNFGHIYGFDTTNTKVKSDVTIRGGLSSELRAPSGSIERLTEVCGFDLSEWAPTLWEVIPYSFVVDYFTNVGDIISCATACTSNVTWLSKSHVDNYRKTVVNTFDPVRSAAALSPSYLMGGGTLGYSESQGGYVSRSIPTLGLPSLEVSAPGFSLKWLNLAALLGGANPFKNAF